MSSLLNYLNLFSSTQTPIEQSTTQSIDIVKTITLTAQDDYKPKSLDLPDNFVGSIYVKSEKYGSACFSFVPYATFTKIISVKGSLYSTRPYIETNGYLTFSNVDDIEHTNDITYTVRIIGI